MANNLTTVIEDLLSKNEIDQAIEKLIGYGWESILDIVEELPYDKLLVIAEKLKENGLYEDEEKDSSVTTIAHGVHFSFQKSKLNDNQYEQLKSNLEHWWVNFDDEDDEFDGENDN